MRADEIRELGAEDITARIQELEEERFRLKFRSATEPLEDPLRLRVLRKDIARLNTVLREQQLKGTGAAATAPAKRAASKSAAKKTTAKRAAKKTGASKKAASSRARS